MRDADLESLARAQPQARSQDVSRAVTAGALLRERDACPATACAGWASRFWRLPLDAIGPNLVSAYLALKQRNVL